jgi:superfamily II RNA helicase
VCEEVGLKTVEITEPNPSFVNVIHAWAEGATFAEVCKLTDAFEGLLSPSTWC